MKRKSIIQKFSICAVLIFVILTSGCATTMRLYTGDPLPKEQVAIIEGSKNTLFLFFYFSGSEIKILEVDGKRLSSPREERVYGGIKRCEVLPGLHNLVVRATFSSALMPFPVPFSSSRDDSLQFNTEAGHQYKIKVRYRYFLKYVFRINVIDTKFGEIVATYPNE